MFKALFIATLLITLVVNIIFLLTARDKPADLVEVQSARRLFSRSNLQESFYDYLPSTTVTNKLGVVELAGEWPERPTARQLQIESSAPILIANQSDTSDFSPEEQKQQEQSRSAKNNNDNEQERYNGSSSARVLDAAGPHNKVIYQDYGSPTSAPTNRDSDAVRPARYLDIGLKSSRNHVQVIANKVIIHESKCEANCQESGRGIHVLVLNQFRGSVMARRQFDTYMVGQDDELVRFVSQVREGRILVFAVQDEASFKMGARSGARKLLAALGSRQISRLGWRDMWSCVLIKRDLLETNRTLGESWQAHLGAQSALLAERLEKSLDFASWAPAARLEVRLKLEPESGERTCKWALSSSSSSAQSVEETRRRARFCAKVEGYAPLCDCNSASQIGLESASSSVAVDQAGWQLAKVPVLVMASNRAHYLYRMLRSLLNARGLNSSQVSVYIDGFHEEPLEVARLFGLRAFQSESRGSKSARISHHYKTSLASAFALNPEAEFVIIFEEDLDVAKDALVYFNQTLPVLQQDPTLYCVSCWNDQGYEHSSHDPRLILRLETMPGLGWMLGRDLFKRELEPNWPSERHQHDWDMWIRTERVRRGRECLVPEVSRTFHFGATGTNINSYFQRQYFSGHNFQRQPQRHFAHLDQLEAGNYELALERAFASARVYNGTEPCKLLRPPSEEAPDDEPHQNGRLLKHSKQTNEQANSTTVIYIEMIDERDFANWLALAKCWRIWDLDARGQHNSMWHLAAGGAGRLLVVGVPASPYAKFKPSQVRPIRLVAGN